MKIEAYAKINLTLEVLGVRSDGYHALRSVVMPVSLSDSLEIVADSQLYSDTGYADDLCIKAARALDVNGGARICVHKRIPVGGGLGGGSADAASTLIALNEMWRLGKSRTELAEIGSRIGSDVPSLVISHERGPVIMEGRGEIVTCINGCSPLHVVLVNPGISVSTKAVYENCSVRDPGAPSQTDVMVQALSTHDLNRIVAAVANDLAQPAIRMNPIIGELMKALRSDGAIGVSMSGSGSTVFGLVPSRVLGEKIVGNFQSRGIMAWCVRSIGC